MTVTITPPLPPPPSPPPVTGDRRRVPARVALATLAAGAVLVDLAVTTALQGWAALAATAVVVATLVTVSIGWRRPAGGTRSVQAGMVAATALAPAFFLAVRASPWLLLLDVPAVLGLLALGGALAPGGSLFDASFTTLARQVGSLSLSMIYAPATVVEAIAGSLPAGGGRRHGHYGALARGLLLTVPLVVVLAATLASGDAVFASLFHVDVRVPDLGDHVVGTLLGLWLVAGILAHAARARPRTPGPQRPVLGPVEGAVVLGGLILVYALFALARLLVALRGDDYVLRTTGLTYAEYARSGFFQLLAAAALTVVVLLGLRAAVALPTPASRWLFAAMAATAVALTEVMVHSATVRLGLYDAVFGLTMLRLYSSIFGWWIGGVLALVGVALCGIVRGEHGERAGATRSWLPGAIACSALAVLLVVNVLDPEQFVMTRNVATAGETGRFDVDYALSLSDDARPALVEALDRLPAPTGAEVRRRLCAPLRRAPEPSWNLSVLAAGEARARACAPS
jgi:hypothetical protein